MELDDTLKSLVLQTFDSHQIKAAAVARGMVTLRRDGIQKVLDGITTVEEVLRVTQR
jgi:general secretion pathway protein E